MVWLYNNGNLTRRIFILCTVTAQCLCEVSSKVDKRQKQQLILMETKAAVHNVCVEFHPIVDKAEAADSYAGDSLK